MCLHKKIDLIGTYKIGYKEVNLYNCEDCKIKIYYENKEIKVLRDFNKQNLIKKYQK